MKMGESKSRLKRAAVCLGLLAGMAGCAGSSESFNSSSTTRPALATDIDPAQAKSEYWLKQPAVASVNSADYDLLWNACAQTALDYQFTLDRRDYREGVMTTLPMVSKQWFEVWRKDAGSFDAVMESSLQTVRRSIRFQIVRRPGGGFTAEPRVLVERLSLANRHVTAVVEYPSAVSGPASDQPPDIVNDITIPSHNRYWYAIGRDLDMERDVADSVRGKLPADR